MLLGHSVRRGEFGFVLFDVNAALAARLQHALKAGVRVIFCIGGPKGSAIRLGSR